MRGNSFGLSKKRRSRGEGGWDLRGCGWLIGGARTGCWFIGFYSCDNFGLKKVRILSMIARVLVLIVMFRSCWVMESDFGDLSGFVEAVRSGIEKIASSV